MEPPSPKKSSRRQVTSFSSAYSIAVSPMATISTRASRLGAAAACRAVVAPGSWVVGGAWAGSENDGKPMGNLCESTEIYGNLWEIYGNLWSLWEILGGEKWRKMEQCNAHRIYMMEDCWKWWVVNKKNVNHRLSPTCRLLFANLIRDWKTQGKSSRFG